MTFRVTFSFGLCFLAYRYAQAQRPVGPKDVAGDLEMAPGQEGAKPSGKGLVNHLVFAFNGDYSLRRQRGCEVKRETLSRGPHSLAPAGASEVPSKFPICLASVPSQKFVE